MYLLRISLRVFVSLCGNFKMTFWRFLSILGASLVSFYIVIVSLWLFFVCISFGSLCFHRLLFFVFLSCCVAYLCGYFLLTSCTVVLISEYKTLC